jgi:dTDP-4-amino-4,6-dideoxygalactose transaminase
LPILIGNLFSCWADSTVPFNTILLFEDGEIREKTRKHLISKNIFATVHWQQPKEELSSNDYFAIDLSNRLMTIPSDHRYTEHDMQRIIEEISNV